MSDAEHEHRYTSYCEDCGAVGYPLQRAEEQVSTLEARIAELTDRIVTGADEAFGPFPVQTADEALTAIERGIFEMRQKAEARIAELERERDEHKSAMVILAQTAGDGAAELLRALDENRGVLATVLADRDEAVRLLREAPGSAIENDWERQRRAYLALHPVQPKTPNAPPKNGETE